MCPELGGVEMPGIRWTVHSLPEQGSQGFSDCSPEIRPTVLAVIVVSIRSLSISSDRKTRLNLLNRTPKFVVIKLQCLE